MVRRVGKLPKKLVKSVDPQLRVVKLIMKELWSLPVTNLGKESPGELVPSRCDHTDRSKHEIVVRVGGPNATRGADEVGCGLSVGFARVVVAASVFG